MKLKLREALVMKLGLELGGGYRICPVKATLSHLECVRMGRGTGPISPGSLMAATIFSCLENLLVAL